ncbi:MAG: acyl-ACP--UDP-N-acetylglucosamine O-acyltransferase [Bdellovibrionales bacterium]|nr:acyl-ACP--UDP-N-acetylglucosamine O-acyltransferase [Bdellovibrionales bacterium]
MGEDFLEDIMQIHPSSVVSKDAEIEEGAIIGPFCVIEGKVKIGSCTVLDSNVKVGNPYGTVIIGKGNHLFPGSNIGGIPQDLKYKKENTELIIGNNNQFRESVTVNTGTVTGINHTKIGDGNLLMAYSHIGHDCVLGNNNVIANSVAVAGHVTIQDKVTVGGLVGLSQFITVGSYAFVAGYSAVNKDVLPFSMASGIWATMRATNKVGMERAGFTEEDISIANKLIRMFSKSGLRREEVISKATEELGGEHKVTKMMLDFAHKSKGLAI